MILELPTESMKFVHSFKELTDFVNKDFIYILVIGVKFHLNPNQLDVYKAFHVSTPKTFGQESYGILHTALFNFGYVKLGFERSS